MNLNFLSRMVGVGLLLAGAMVSLKLAGIGGGFSFEMLGAGTPFMAVVAGALVLLAAGGPERYRWTTLLALPVMGLVFVTEVPELSFDRPAVNTDRYYTGSNMNYVAPAHGITERSREIDAMLDESARDITNGIQFAISDMPMGGPVSEILKPISECVVKNSKNCSKRVFDLQPRKIDATTGRAK